MLQDIPTGQLVKDEGFTLFEAVGALEVLPSPTVGMISDHA